MVDWYCDCDCGFNCHCDGDVVGDALIKSQDMLRPTVEELVRVKDVDVQMREFLANLRVTVEAGQKGKKKKAKKKPKKKKEKKGKKKKDPTEGRSMERCATAASMPAFFSDDFSVSMASLSLLASSSPVQPPV